MENHHHYLEKLGIDIDDREIEEADLKNQNIKIPDDRMA